MEVEAKYRVAGRLEPAAIARLDLAPYHLAPACEHRLDDVILDSAERGITAAGAALRVRHDGPRLLLTFKSGGEVRGAVHRREEEEAELRGPALEPAAWPAAIRARVAALVGQAPLAPLARVSNRRFTWQVLRDNREIAELALDDGVIAAGGRREPFHELELELKASGTPADLATLEERLRAALPLQPEPRSKLARALALLAPAADPPAPRPGAPPSASESDLAAAAAPSPAARPLLALARAAVARSLARLRKAEHLARADADPEAVHDLRVATRRIRATLATLEQAGVARRRGARLRRRLRALARRLADLRDLDVFLAHLDASRADRPAAEQLDLDLLRAHLLERRAAARAEMLAVLDERATRRLLDRLAAWAEDETLPPPRPGCPALVRHALRSAIWRRYETLLAFEVAPPTPADQPAAPPPAPAIETLHRARIAVKRLRYTLELFAPALGPERDALLAELVAAQDHLGELQDHVVALAMIDPLLARHPGALGLAAYRGARAAHQAALAAASGPLLARLASHHFAALLAQALRDV